MKTILAAYLMLCIKVFLYILDQNCMKVTRKVRKNMKIGSKEWEENSEDVYEVFLRAD